MATILPSQQIWIYAGITLVNKGDGTTSKTINVSNRPFNNTTGSIFYWPIIQSVGNVGARMSDNLPRSISGDFVLDNSPGSFGFERRFSDLLERYAIVNQPITIYYILTNDAATGPGQPEDGRLHSEVTAFTGRVSSWIASPGSKTITLQIDTSVVPIRYVGRVIEKANFASAPDSSIGKPLPLLFGTYVQAPALRVDADADTSPAYAWGLKMRQGASEFAPLANPLRAFTKDPYGALKLFYPTATPSTAVYSNAGAAASTDTPMAVFDQNTGETAHWLEWPTTARRLLTQIEIAGHGTGSDGLVVKGSFTARIYEGTGTAGANPPGKMVGEATVDGAAYQTSFRGAGEFWMQFTFKEPVLLNSDKGYFLAVEQCWGGGTAVSFNTTGTFTAASAWSKHDGGEWANDGTYSTYRWRFQAYGVGAAAWSSGTWVDGYDAVGLELSQRAAISGYANPDLTKLEYVFDGSGTQDDSAGTITGAASTVLTQPQHVLNLLCRKWNSTANTWDADRLDVSTFSSTFTPCATAGNNYYRAVCGRTNGRVLLSQVLDDICHDVGYRIALRKNPVVPLALWGWGTRGTSSATFTDTDFEISTIYQQGSSAIVNTENINYARTITAGSAINSTAGTWGKNGNYQPPSVAFLSTINVSATKGAAPFQSLAAISKLLYDERHAADADWTWIYDDESAETMAEFNLRVFEHPWLWVEGYAPLIKYGSLDMFDTVTIIHPDLPAYYGTAPIGELPIYNQTPVDIVRGWKMNRAEPYRAIIEGREVDFNSGGFPRLKLLLRLLVNKNDPT